MSAREVRETPIKKSGKQRKLGNREVALVRQRLRSGDSVTALARFYDVTVTTIRSIRDNKFYREVG